MKKQKFSNKVNKILDMNDEELKDKIKYEEELRKIGLELQNKNNKREL